MISPCKPIAFTRKFTPTAATHCARPPVQTTWWFFSSLSPRTRAAIPHFSQLHCETLTQKKNRAAREKQKQKPQKHKNTPQKKNDFFARLRKGHAKKTPMEPCRKFASSCDLPTYLPEHREKPHPKGAGVAGEVARYHGRFCFCCAHAPMCGFQYKCPPSPLAI